jgi:hypothetical protein
MKGAGEGWVVMVADFWPQTWQHWHGFKLKYPPYSVIVSRHLPKPRGFTGRFCLWVNTSFSYLVTIDESEDKHQ